MDSLHLSFDTPLRIVVEQQQPPQAQVRGIFELQFGSFKVKGENMSTAMPSGTLGTVTCSWVDAGGNPAPVDGPTACQSSDTTIVTVTPSAGNPLIADLYAVGPIGDVSIQATADADMGAGVTSITALLALTVIAGQAVAGTLVYTQGPQGPPSSGGPA